MLIYSNRRCHSAGGLCYPSAPLAHRECPSSSRWVTSSASRTRSETGHSFGQLDSPTHHAVIRDGEPKNWLSRSWLGGRDSNPDRQIQNLQSYRWTTSQQQ